MRKNRLIILAIVISVILCVGCSNKRISRSLAEQVKVGDTYDEIVDLLGKEHAVEGSGICHYLWNLKSGETLIVRFDSDFAVSHISIEYFDYDPPPRKAGCAGS